MMSNEAQKRRLQKLYNLAQKAEGAEQKTAQRKLEDLLIRYKVSLQEVLHHDGLEEKSYPYSTKEEKHLLFQLMYRALGAEEIFYFQRNKKIVVKVTKAQHLQISEEFALYRKA